MSFENSYHEIMQKIYKLCSEYEKKYSESPKYIKIPYWVCYHLEMCTHQMIGEPRRIDSSRDVIKTIFGMTVCLTKSITKLEDMEVF